MVYVRASNSDGHTCKVISEPVYRIYSLKVNVGMGSKYTCGSDVSTKADIPKTEEYVKDWEAQIRKAHEVARNSMKTSQRAMK